MKFLLYSNSIIQLLMMLFVPYQILAIQQATSNLPMVLGVGMISGGLTSIYIGKKSDQDRRGTFLFGIMLLILVIFGYTFANSLLVIVILHTFYGISFAICNISEKAVIADLAMERGKDIGKYQTALYVASGVALIISSLFVIPVYVLFPSIAVGLSIPYIIIFKYLKNIPKV